MAELPYFMFDEIYELMGYTNKKAAYNAVTAGNFPVATYKLNRMLVSDREVVRTFFAKERARGVHELLD